MERRDWERLVQRLMSESVLRSPLVIRAMKATPRSAFLPEDMQSYSATDTPLPIGFGQTISAPHSLSFDAGLGETWSQ